MIYPAVVLLYLDRLRHYSAVEQVADIEHRVAAVFLQLHTVYGALNGLPVLVVWLSVYYDIVGIMWILYICIWVFYA